MVGVRRAALLTAGLSLAGAALGLVRDLAIAVVFGAGAEVDAFLVAQGLMNLVLGLVTGALAKAAVPVVARSVEAGRPEAGIASVRAALGLSCAVLAVGASAVWVGADAVVALLAPGFDPATAALAVELTRIVLVATVLVAATNLLAGAGQALGRFGPAAAQSIGFNLVMIVAAAVAGPVVGATALAWGFVLGSAVRLLLQLIPFRAARLSPLPTLRLADPGLREMLRLVPALVVGSALSSVNTLVDRAVGSTLGEGAVAAVNFAGRLSSTVDLLLVATLLAALYPRLSAAVAPGRRCELRDLVGRGTGVLVVVLAPVGVGMALAAEPLVRLVFGYGAFDGAAVALTASAAAVFALGLPVLAVREVAARTCYALGDGTVPVVSALAGMAVNVTGDLLLAPVLGVAGIAAATVASGTAAAAVTLAGLHRRHRAVPRLGRLAAGLPVAVAVGAGTGLLARLVAAPAAPDGPAGAALVCAAVGLGVLAGYLPVLRFACPAQFALLAGLRGELRRSRGG
ncbi:MAG TPA: lipid II flippase MurJ [Pseudonocardia sp.]|nr:lipid II flippase MurJ [Pseudonocardia sp.]